MIVEVNRQDIEEIVITLHNIARQIEQHHDLGPIGHSVRSAADQLSSVTNRLRGEA